MKAPFIIIKTIVRFILLGLILIQVIPKSGQDYKSVVMFSFSLSLLINMFYERYRRYGKRPGYNHGIGFRRSSLLLDIITKYYIREGKFTYKYRILSIVKAEGWPTTYFIERQQLLGIWEQYGEYTIEGSWSSWSNMLICTIEEANRIIEFDKSGIQYPIISVVE